jgi:hypothetical protein
MKSTEQHSDRAYSELKQVSDKLLAAAEALSPKPGAGDGPGVLALPGLLAKLRAAAEDVAAVNAQHAALPRDQA